VRVKFLANFRKSAGRSELFLKINNEITIKNLLKVTKIIAKESFSNKIFKLDGIAREFRGPEKTRKRNKNSLLKNKKNCANT